MMLVRLGKIWVDPEEVCAIAPDEACYGSDVYLRSVRYPVHACDFLTEEDLLEAGLIGDPVGVIDSGEPEITEEELQELRKFYKQGFFWVAKDKTGAVRVFRSPPRRDGAYWSDGNDTGRCIHGDYDWLDEDARCSVPLEIVIYLGLGGQDG